MSGAKTFFRYCPACGKRFHIRLANKKLLRDERETRVRKEVASNARILVGSSRQPILPAIVEVDVPVTVEVQDFELSYECNHCGHMWTERNRLEREVKK
jgi:predicted RNA-binding Zn-ribbon protein involved in translation (DUF1610 family)